LERQVQRYRGARPLPELRKRTVLLVNDALTTGMTAHAALQAVREKGPARLVLAVPVAAAETAEALRRDVDALVSVEEPPGPLVLDTWYGDFHAVSDEEVLTLLAHARQATLPPSAPVSPSGSRAG
jgi:predicted phosphoribosyltransferase